MADANGNGAASAHARAPCDQSGHVRPRIGRAPKSASTATGKLHTRRARAGTEQPTAASRLLKPSRLRTLLSHGGGRRQPSHHARDKASLDSLLVRKLALR